MTNRDDCNKQSAIQDPMANDDNGQKAPTETPGTPGPMVGIGASAGGLEALKAFFSKVPEHSGLGFIVVVHMTPNQPSMMAQLLQKVAGIPVKTAEDGEAVQPDTAYVVPPSKEINIFQGAIQLLDMANPQNHLPINFFFRSLAQDQKTNAAGIVMSGTGTDGTLGLKEIKSLGGLTIVQSEASAKYSGMPKSAIAGGNIDMVLSPDQMPEKVMDFYQRLKTIPRSKGETDFEATDGKQHWLFKIFALLRNHTGHDFSSYKKNTILRRISRRMGLNHIDTHDTYIRHLRENSAEIESLFRELLIGVTSFFRDSESFDILKKKILPDLFDQMNPDAPFRVWVPGCSTGEEVYSLAMVFRECMDQYSKRIALQLFGTDIDNYAIDKAREGLFPASISADISPERLKRFFTKEDDSFRIRKEIRDLAIFSVQDIIKDPPFSRLNLLCCRNLLIYLDSSAQKKILPLFHYTLTPGGILMLGSSETIGGFTNLFDAVDTKWKVFRARDVPHALRGPVEFPTGTANQFIAADATARDPSQKKINLGELTRKVLLDQFTPAAVLVDAKANLLQVQGRTGKYLEAVSGPPSQNLLDMAREGLRIELSAALRNASSSGEIEIRKSVGVKTNGDVQLIDLHVYPVNTPKALAGRYLVVFQDVAAETTGDPASTTDVQGDSRSGGPRIDELEKELQFTRESHQTAVEELESSNEELKSTNEELQSSNEELQSTNEELESSKEELQSLNEELQTVNSELQNKVEELSEVQDDIHNLLNSTEVGTIFVNNELCIKRFTRAATKIVNLIQSDIGRPLRHVVSNLNYDEMITDLQEVLDKLTPKELEVQATDGHWYLMRILPYRTTDNRIDGAVMTFSRIDEQKIAQKALTDKNDMELLIHNVFDTNLSPMAVLDAAGALILANTSFYDLMNISQDHLLTSSLFELKDGLLGKTDLKAKLGDALSNGRDFISTTLTVSTKQRNKQYTIHGRIVRQDTDLPYRILLYFQEVKDGRGS